jgi:Family of unknown function (DUF6599)
MIREKKNNSRRQTFLSMVILSMLLVIGAGIWITQSRFNAGVLNKDAILPAADKNKPLSKLAPNTFFAPLPEGIQPLTSMEMFDARTLSDKIDGKAELYLSAGFIRLVSQRFKDERTADLWLEAYVYDMGNSQNAFSVFSAQRREDAASLDLSQNAYRTPNAVFLTHGRYYLEIIASKASEKVPPPVKIMAETFIHNTPAEKVTLNETALFPKQDRVKNSIVLIAANAFGYEGFDKIYTAEYELNDQRLTAYLSHRKTNEKAQKMASAYTQFLLTYGGQKIEEPLPIKDARMIKILDTYEIVFSHGPYLAGIREAATVHQAKTLADRLYRRIKETDNGSRSKP